MPNPPLSSGKRHAPSGATGKARPEDLVRLLVNRCAKATAGSPQNLEQNYIEEVVLDIDVDGTRYLLVRLPKPSKARVRLSPREHEIVRMVALGHPNKTIADVLSISSWTVCTHLRRIFAKLGVGSRAAMVARLHDEVGRLDSTSAQNALGRGSTTRDGEPASIHPDIEPASVAYRSASGWRRTS